MKGNGGFTLIELILVTVIIGILAAMVVPVFGGRITEAKIRAAKGDIAMYQGAIQLYALDHNDAFPKSLQELANPSGGRVYVKELNKDPWGNEYVYVPGTDAKLADFKVYSAGPDGIPDNDDDVTSQTDDGSNQKTDEGSSS